MCMVSTLEARPRLSSHPRPNLLPAQVGLLASKPPAVHPRLPEVRTSPYSTQSCLVKLFQVFGRFNWLGSLCFPCAVCTSILPSPTQYWWQLSKVSWYYVTFLCLKIGSLQIGRHLEAGGRSLWKFQLVVLAPESPGWSWREVLYSLVCSTSWSALLPGVLYFLEGGALRKTSGGVTSTSLRTGAAKWPISSLWVQAMASGLWRKRIQTCNYYPEAERTGAEQSKLN